MVAPHLIAYSGKTHLMKPSTNPVRLTLRKASNKILKDATTSIEKVWQSGRHRVPDFSYATLFCGNVRFGMQETKY